MKNAASCDVENVDVRSDTSVYAVRVVCRMK